ncbi:MAG: TetR/AcrR family transcriptional regulator [Acidimicrobiales bacterium]
MARRARFSHDDVLDAAVTAVGVAGPTATVADVAHQLGGPVGSIYHRFASREELLARLWLREVGRFQRGLFAVDPGPEADAGTAHDALVAMALHVPRYCRRHHAEARALTLYRQSRLLTDCPAGLEETVRTVNHDLEALTQRMTLLRFGSAQADLTAITVRAVRVSAYGLVRPHLGGPVPRAVDAAVEAAADAILRLGDG